jgi:hypothetical protein
MRKLILRLHCEAVLSEGQAAKAMDCGRTELRIMADAYNNRPALATQWGSTTEGK